MRSVRYRVAAAVAAISAGSSASAASPATEHFAGEALTVAFAFCFPALAAGAYLGVQRLKAHTGTRTIAAVLLVVIAIGAGAAMVEDKTSLFQRAGLASLASR